MLYTMGACESKDERQENLNRGIAELSQKRVKLRIDFIYKIEAAALAISSSQTETIIDNIRVTFAVGFFVTSINLCILLK